MTRNGTCGTANGATGCPEYNLTEKVFGKSSVTCDSTNSLVVGDLSTLKAPYSISMWFNIHGGVTSAGSPSVIMLFGDVSGTVTYPKFGFSNDASNNKVPIIYRQDRLRKGKTLFNAAPFNQWWHVVFVVQDEEATNYRIYLNGAEESYGDTTNTGVSKNFSTSNAICGQDGYSGYASFNGSIDEFALWNRSLSSAEILSLYKRGVLSLNVSVRSCDDSSCAGESFSETLTNNSGIKLNTSITPNNRYFQYRAVLNTIDVNYTPTLHNVTINYSLITNLTIWDDTDTITKVLGKPIRFYANFTDGRDSINASSNVNCSFSHNLTGAWAAEINMSFNSTLGIYYIDRQFDTNRTDSSAYFNVSCDATILGYNKINTLEPFIVYPSLNITVNLNPSSVSAGDSVQVSGHINLSNNTNVSNTGVNIFLNEVLLNISNLTKLLVTSRIENGTQFSAGTAINTTVNANNITLKVNATNQYPNQTGNFASQVIDLGSTLSNFTLVSWSTELPYQAEIGRALSDSSTVSVKDQNTFGYINTSGLISLYYFNNESAFGENATGGEGDVVRDFSPEANSERSGSLRNNGTTKGGATINRTDYKLGGGAGEFDGSDDFVSTRDFDAIDGQSAFTVTAWINTNTVANDKAIMVKGDNFLQTGGSSYGGVDDMVFGLDGNKFVYTTGNFISTGRWIHVAATYDSAIAGSTNTEYRIYIDGVSRSLTSFSANPDDLSSTAASTEVFVIGRYSVAAGRYWNGTIDEVSVWNRTLSEAEIKSIYKRGVLSLNVSVRSCDDSSCSGETFSEALTNSSGILLNTSITPNNRYFQYRAVLNTLDVNYTPALYNVTINYTAIATDSFGNYNFTFAAPSTGGAYSIK